MRAWLDIKEEYENGRDYYALRGRPLLVLPQRQVDRPAPPGLRRDARRRQTQRGLVRTSRSALAPDWAGAGGPSLSSGTIQTCMRREEV